MPEILFSLLPSAAVKFAYSDYGKDFRTLSSVVPSATEAVSLSVCWMAAWAACSGLLLLRLLLLLSCSHQSAQQRVLATPPWTA